MDHTLNFTQELADYVSRVGVREHDVLARCRKETAAGERLAVMQISPVQGAFMALLVQIMNARNTIEIGVFTGYSALAVALALPAEGRVTACEIDPDLVAKAKVYWQAAGVADKIDARIGPAADTLDEMIREAAGTTPYDFAFIDADKEGYDAYYEKCLALLRPGGLLAIDNVLWSGSVINPERNTPETIAIRRLNEKIATDGRVDICLAPIGDGLFLCRKR